MSVYQEYLDFLSENYKSDQEEVVELYEGFKSSVLDLIKNSETQFIEMEKKNISAINSSRTSLESKINEINKLISLNEDTLKTTKSDLISQQNDFSNKLNSDLTSSLDIVLLNVTTSLFDVTTQIENITQKQQDKITKIETTVRVILYLAGFTTLTTLALLITFIGEKI